MSERKYTHPSTPFWDRVDTSSPDGCWPWLAGATRGRGQLHYQGRKQKAYRVAWQLTNGPIPDGQFVCHSCDNPICVRPDHLFLGTHADNMRDMAEKGRYKIPELRGEACAGGRAFPDSIVEEARRLYATGEWTHSELGARFGASPSTVGRWCRGDQRPDSAGPRLTPGRGSYRGRWRTAS